MVDVVAVLTDSLNPTDYLKKLRKRDTELGFYLGTNCPQVEMETETGKISKTLGGSVQHILRLVQSIPSPKAEPFKQWLAKVGYERLQDMSDPARSLDRAREYWQQHGRSDKWIQQRMMGQETRNKLTDYWKDNEINKENGYAILTDIIHKEWSDVSVKKHKDIKGLKTQNLRDHMSEAELIFTALAELSTRQIAESVDATEMAENADAGKKGGKIAKKARLELESKTDKTKSRYYRKRRIIVSSLGNADLYAVFVSRIKSGTALVSNFALRPDRCFQLLSPSACLPLCTAPKQISNEDSLAFG